MRSAPGDQSPSAKGNPPCALASANSKITSAKGDPPCGVDSAELPHRPDASPHRELIQGARLQRADPPWKDARTRASSVEKGGSDKTARICLTAMSHRTPAPHRETTQGTGLTQICTDLPDGDFLQDASPAPLTGKSYRERSTGSRSILHGHRPNPPGAKSLAHDRPR